MQAGDEKVPNKIDAQFRNLKFWLSLTKKENKFSQITNDDIKWNENKAFWSEKNHEHIKTDMIYRTRRILDKSTLYMDSTLIIIGITKQMFN